MAVSLGAVARVGGDASRSLPRIVESAAVAGDPGNTLRGELRLRTAAPVTLDSVELRSRDGHGFRVSPPGETTRDHTVPLLGLRSDREYTVSVRIVPEDASGPVSFEAGRLRTGRLPDHLPPVEATAPPGGGPTLTLFDVTFGIPAARFSGASPTSQRSAGDLSYLVVVDQDGEIVWYHGEEQPIQDARRSAAGTLLFIHHETGIREISPQGDLVGEWIGTTGSEVVTKDGAVRVETDQMHHAVAELENGNLITLSREVRTLRYPGNLCGEERFDGTYPVAGDVVVEFRRDTGQVVREFSLFDVLDPLDNLGRTRAHEFCGTYLRAVYPNGADGRPVRDWSHANALVLDEDRNAVIVSLRHTDSLVALRSTDDEKGPAGELLWELGDGRDFEMVGGGEWFLHAHAPEVLPDGSLLLYDNGNERPGTTLGASGNPPYSRAVRYRIDERAGTVEQVWEHRAPPGEGPLYAPYVGDADPTPQGTVLITHGGLLEPVAHDPLAPGTVPWARILEVDPSSGTPVLDIQIRDPAGKAGWRTYAAERLATIYPAGYTVTPLP